MVKIVTYRGFNTDIQYDEETSYGAGATPAVAIAGKISQLTVNKVNNIMRTLGLGDGRNETFHGFGNVEHNWNLDYELAGFDFLQFLIGSKHGSGTAAVPYYLQEEEFMDYTAGADSGLKSFGLECAALDKSGGTHEVDTYTGGIINTAGLNLSLGATLKCNLTGFFKSVTSGTSATAFTPNTTKPWIYSQGIFKWNDATVARVQSIAININQGFVPDDGRELGSRFIVAAEPGARKYDWTAVVKMASALATTMRDDFYGIANTPHLGITSAEPTLRNLALELSEGAASGHRNARILLADNSINDISKPVNIGDNLVELTINGQGKKGQTDTTNRPIKYWTVP